MTDRQTVPKQDARPIKSGWAPGNYGNFCCDCGEEFLGDKRAVQCADCAYKRRVAVVGIGVTGVGLVELLRDRLDVSPLLVIEVVPDLDDMVERSGIEYVDQDVKWSEQIAENLYYLFEFILDGVKCTGFDDNPDGSNLPDGVTHVKQVANIETVRPNQIDFGIGLINTSPPLLPLDIVIKSTRGQRVFDPTLNGKKGGRRRWSVPK